MQYIAKRVLIACSAACYTASFCRDIVVAVHYTLRVNFRRPTKLSHGQAVPRGRALCTRQSEDMPTPDNIAESNEAGCSETLIQIRIDCKQNVPVHS